MSIKINSYQKIKNILTIPYGMQCAILILIALFTLLLSGCGTKPKVYKIGVLSGMSFVADTTDGFKEGMTELGYVEGENILYDVQNTEFDMNIYKTTVQKFIDDDVDLIFSFPTEATIMAKETAQGSDVPVLFSFTFIEGMNIVNSIRQPGGNITGVRHPGIDITLRRFEVMNEMMPNAKHLLVPYQKGYPIVTPQLEALYPVAKTAGIDLITVPADSGSDLKVKLQSLGDDVKVDAILLIAEPLGVTPDAFAALGKYATERKIPIGGALMKEGSYTTIYGVSVNSFDSGKQAAPLADKILKGTSAGEIPVLSAEIFLQIDYKAAQNMGIDIPQGLLNQADEVIR